MFRITIGSVDWWYDIFPIVESDGSISIRASTFLISFVILINWFFFQITIAVLLEICQASNREKEKKQASKLILQKQREKALKNPLDRLLLDLAKEYISEEDLKKHLDHLFTVCIHFVNYQEP
jgi:predicted membrane protein